MTDKSVVARRIVFGLFILYVLAILFLLVIPNNYRGHNVLVGGLTWERWLTRFLNAINLVPLRSLSEQIGRILTGQSVVREVIYLVGNIIGFMPLGFFLPVLFIKQRKFLTFLITVILAITVLELVQVITMSGSCDIDDLILNTAGACLGFWIMRKHIRRSNEVTEEDIDNG